jgi:hypothetical protein
MEEIRLASVEEEAALLPFYELVLEFGAVLLSWREEWQREVTTLVSHTPR